MADVTIKNKDNLEAWLESQDQATAVAIATRAAQRAVPNLVGMAGKEITEKDRAVIILPVLRALHASAVVHCGLTTSEAKAAALSTASAAFSAADSAALSAHSAAASAAHSAALSAHSAAASAAHSAADSAALSAAWSMIERDVNHLANSGTPTGLVTAPLWHGAPPEKIAKDWQTLGSALLTDDDGWTFWVQWYEDRLDGKPPANPALEKAILLIPDDIWKRGAQATNTEIARLVREHKKDNRTDAEDNVSPHPAITANGKLDAASNPKTDTPDDSPDLPDLLRRQRGVLGVILDSIATMRGNDFLSAPGALRRYDTEIADHGLRLSIGYLNDMRAIARSEYLSLYRQKLFDTEAGLRRALLNFFALHKEIQTHYPLDAARIDLLESFATPIERPDPAALKDAIEDITEGMAAAIEADAVTEDYAAYMGGMMDDISTITYTPPLAGIPNEILDPDLTDPPSPRMGLSKQIYLTAAAFSGATVRELKKNPLSASAAIYTFLNSPTGQSFLNALGRLRDLLWALFF